jgi:protein-tyrosine-phosphatase
VTTVEPTAAPADPVTVTVGSEFGLNLSSHQSQPLTADVIDSADVMVVAEMDHLLALIDKRPQAFAKTFLLLELASVATPRLPGESLPAWVARHHEGRTPSAVMKSATAFGLSDPYKQGDAKIRKAAQQVVDPTATIATSWRLRWVRRAGCGACVTTVENTISQQSNIGSSLAGMQRAACLETHVRRRTFCHWRPD